MPPETPAEPQRPRIALTAGEPAGIGPELIARLADEDLGADLVVIADAGLLVERADAHRHRPSTSTIPRRRTVAAAGAGSPSSTSPWPRHRAPARSIRAMPRYVLETLARAADGAASGEFDAIVTAPVHKGVINDAGMPLQRAYRIFRRARRLRASS